MRSAAPHLADPSTAPTVKASKGEGTPGSLGTSPVSPCNMMEGIFASSSSGEASPLGSMPSSALTAAAAVAAGLMFTPGQGSTPQGAGPGAQQAAAAGGGSVAGPSSVAGTDADALAAIIDATLAPKPGKRRGRPPGRARTAIIPTEEASAALEPTDAEILERLLQEDPSRRAFPPEELKKLVRREKNRITAAISRQRTQVYTAHLESQVKRLEAEQAALAGWLQAPPQGAPHRVLLSGPLVTSDGAAEQGAAGLMPPPPVRHLSL